MALETETRIEADHGAAAIPDPAPPAGGPLAVGPGSVVPGSVVTLGERFEILTAHANVDTDRPPGDCFLARRTGETQARLQAIVTGMAPLARAELLGQFKAIEPPNLLSLLDYGIVDWQGGDRRLALLFAGAPGPRLMKGPEDVRQPLSEDELLRAIFAPAYTLLSELHSRGIFHGAIRPTNIFHAGSATGAVFGECVSAPPSFFQPALFEPVERAMAEPAGRGPGSVQDDLYALGVTVAILILGQNPLRGLSDEQQIELRIDRGTYGALIGNARVPSGLIEPLRGLLFDETGQRWTLEDLGKWLGGRRQSFRQPMLNRRSSRPLTLTGVEIWNPRSLATALGRNVPESIKLIESGEIDRWLRRNLADVNCATRVADVITTTPAHGKGTGLYEDRLVARIAMALDPEAPIRYRGRSVMPLGIGAALAFSMAKGEPVQPLAELIAAQLPLCWYNMQTSGRGDSLSAVRMFDQYRTILERGGYGYGLERCLYQMMPSAPCMSDMLRRYRVTSTPDLLLALESVASERERRPKSPLDRHIAGYIAARDHQISPPVLNAIATAFTDGERQVAMLNILIGIQRRFGPPALPHIADWFLGLMASVVERYHSRETRKQVEKDLAASAKNGDLAAFQKLVDDPETIAADEQGFRQARGRYARLADEIERLRRHALDRARIELTIGRETAAIVSAALAVLIAGAILLLELH